MKLHKEKIFMIKFELLIIFLIKENISVIKNKDTIIQNVVNYIINDDITFQTNTNHFIGEISILLVKSK